LERSISSSGEALSQNNDSNADSQTCNTEIVKPESQAESTGSPWEVVMWEGVLPPPTFLEEYNKLVPEGAERLFKMVEMEQKNRIANERADRDNISAIVQGTEDRLAIGQWTASLISVFGIVAFFALLWTERYNEAGAFATLLTSLAVLVRALKQDGKNIDDSEEI
jgi:uncharacterized membrane protein